jgi:hypothetical protein
MKSVENHLYACYLLHVGPWLALSSTFKIEPKRPFVQSADFQRNTLRFIQENATPHDHHWENLKSYDLTNVLKDPTLQTYRRMNMTSM